MSALDYAAGFVDFLSRKGHIRHGVELVHEPGRASGMFFSQKEGRYRVFLSDVNSLYHEIAHIVLKEDGIEPLSILLDPGAPEWVGPIAGSAITNFYVNSLLQSFFEGDAPEGVLKGIELYRMDKGAQFKNSMTLGNFTSSKNSVLGFYNLFAALSVARSLKLPGLAISLERLAAEADNVCCSGGLSGSISDNAVAGWPGFSTKLSQLRQFTRSLPEYGVMKRMCAESPLPQAELTVKLFNLLSSDMDLSIRESSRERIVYFIK